MNRPRQRTSGDARSLVCECGREKIAGEIGCRRCQRLEANSAGTSRKRAGISGHGEHFADVKAACDEFFTSRGIKRLKWRSCNY